MKLNTKSLILIFITALTLLSPSIFSLKPANAQTTTVKVLDPIEGDTSIKFNNTHPPPTAPNYPLGYLLINITVNDVTQLAAWQINITWDPTLLQIANKSINADMYVPADNVFGGYADMTVPVITDSSAYWMVGIKLGAPFTYISGSGTLCQIKFNITRAPTENETLYSNIHLVVKGEYPIYTKLVDPDGEPISFTPEDGYYEYSLPPPPPPPPPPSEGTVIAIKPPEIIDPSLLPPAKILYNVTIKNVTDMYGYAFKINYNPAILSCLNLQFIDILGEPNYLPIFSVDNINGLITVNVTYFPPATPITTEEVDAVIITFRVKGIGATPIDLNDTSLIDSIGRSIPHDARDGLFANIVRDLAVTNVVPSSDWVYKSNKIEINVTVKNQGEIVETSITVNIFYNDSLLANFTIPSLDPDEEVTTTIEWDTKDVTACNQYTISATVPPVEYEIETTNNEYTDGIVKVRIYGDVDGDDTVSVSDVQLIKIAVPSSPSDPQWNPYADLNDDGIVDIVDYQRIKAVIGGYCTP